MRGKRLILTVMALAIAAVILASVPGCVKNGPGDPDVSAGPATPTFVPSGIDPAEIIYPPKAPVSPVLTVNNMTEYPVFKFDSGALKDGVRFESPVPGSDVRGICIHFTNTSQVRKGQEIVFYINGTEAGRYSRDTGSQYVDLTSARSAVAAGENLLTASLPSGTKFSAELYVYSDALAVNATLEIQAITETVVPEALYGMNMEITRSCWYGGLSAQLLNNRKFFALRQGDVPEGWTVSGGRTVTDDRDHSICGSNYVVLEKGGQLVYSDMLALDKGTEYELELWTAAREGNGSGSVTVFIGGEKLGEFGSGTEAEAHKLSFRAMTEGGTGVLSVRCDGGSVEVFEASILPAANFYGMNIDAVAALKALGPVTLRYPGGCCADRFDWKESIKPAAYRRPMEADEPGYTGMGSFLYTSTYNQDPLDFGLEEFFCLCEEVGAKAELTVSLVRGNENDAAELVRYCKDNSHDVSAWFIGNEIYFFGGSLASDPVLAASVTDKYITAMRNVESDIRVVVGACDNAPEFVRWTGSYFGKLAELGTKYDYVSVHNYYGQVVDFTDRYKAEEFLKTTCVGFVSSPLPVIKSMAEVLNTAGVLNTADPAVIDGAGLYLDEWNWGFNMAPSTMMFLGDSAYLLSMLRTVAEYPLTAASFFHPFEGMIVSSGSARELSGSGYAYELLKAHIGGNIAESRLSSGLDNVSLMTTVSEDKMIVSVVNLGNESLLLDLSSVRSQGFNGEVSVKVIRANTLSLKDEATLSAGNIELYSLTFAAVDSTDAEAADPSDATSADSPLSVLIPGCALVQITAG